MAHRSVFNSIFSPASVLVEEPNGAFVLGSSSDAWEYCRVDTGALSPKLPICILHSSQRARLAIHYGCIEAKLECDSRI